MQPSTVADLETEFFAAGMLEGALTCRDIEAYSHNVREATSPPSSEALRFLREQFRYVRSEAEQRAAHEDYWQAVAAVLSQFDGMLEGYNRFCSDLPMSEEDLLRLNADGDLFDIMVAFPNSQRKAAQFLSAQAPDLGRRFRPKERCSALFKLTANHSDLFFGHDTWDTYATAGPRLFKTYILPVRRSGRIEKHVDVFSSSPGYLSSVDDYYTLSGTAQLAVVETSLNVNRLELYASLRPQTVPCWLRAMASNMLARNASDWVAIFSYLHSGTYNSQWMILNLQLFNTAGAVPGVFWVAEEMPGAMVSADMSQHLRQQSYWASYNVAFFERTRLLMNETSSWSEDPRALLFHALQGSVQTIEGMQSVMGWNDYRHSSISQGNPTKAIMSRGDLLREHPRAAGGLDAKVSSARLYSSSMVTYARVGPTHDDVAPFCWETAPLQLQSTPHRRHPACFNFTWECLWPGRSEPVVFM